MIDTLKDKMNENNMKMINQLEEIINGFNIKDEKSLQELEENFFVIDNEKVDKIEFCLRKINNDDYIFEFMPSEDVRKLHELKDLFNAEENYEKKLFYLVKMFDIAGYDLYLPYTAYKHIMNGDL